MKKVFIIVAILLATATTITIVSCKKDKENMTKPDYLNKQTDPHFSLTPFRPIML